MLSESVLVSRWLLGMMVGCLVGQSTLLSLRIVAAEPPLPAQVSMIDQKIAEGWKDFQLTPSKVEDDGLWCRRVFLDVLGRIPTFKEFQEFSQVPPKERRSALIDRLLDSDRYTEEYAARWSVVWANILIGRNGGLEQNTLIDRGGMEKYLRDSFASNKPYNEMVYELVTATGTTKPGTKAFNGATNFLVMKVNTEEGTQATSAVSRIFLGLQVQCTQCHNHPFNQWKQQKFWDFNAFFRQTRALRRFVSGTNDIDHCELIDQDFAGESGRIQEADLFFQLRNGVTKVAYPVFVDGTEIGRSGFVDEVNRRKELGKMVVTSEYLEKMAVNRMWGQFLGYGFTKPVDDLGPHNPASHPELLDYLAAEFRKSSFDNKQLMRWILLSKPYQLSSRTTKDNSQDDPTLGEKPQFSHYYTRQMGPEELYQSLVAATQVDRKGSLEEQERRRKDWLSQFVVAYGTDDGGETSTFNGSIPQSLMMFNGELIREATSIESGSWLDQIGRAPGKLPEKVNFLFIAGMGRKASKDELIAADQLLAARKGNAVEMLQDLWWAILNSNEFIIKH